MKEKVLWLNLPDGARYQKVIVTEDGRIGIVYSEEATNQPVVSRKVEPIPSPKPLIGGTDVYQREDSPYWYCNLKNGRDMFMCLPTEELTEADLFYDTITGKPRIFKSEEEKEFRDYCLSALAMKPKEGYVWLPVFEPTFDRTRMLQFVPNSELNLDCNCDEFWKLCMEYSPENSSDMASISTYFLIAVSWLKYGIATVDQLIYGCGLPALDDGKTGLIKFGGLCGIIGKSSIIVRNPIVSSGYSYVGSRKGAFANVEKVHYPDISFHKNMPLIQLGN